MTWMLTASGQAVGLHSMRFDDVRIADIAHHLAQINRFSGACRRPYSVAEHSLLVAEIARRELQLDVHGQLAALLHDAHEAYCGDVTSPMKDVLGRPWRTVEDNLQQGVQAALGVVVASAVNRKAIRRADLMALAAERHVLLLAAGPTWGALEDVPLLRWAIERVEDGALASWWVWRDSFAAAHARLDTEREQAALRWKEGA